MTTDTRKSLDFIHDDVRFYPHQIEGVRDLARRSSFILADEPGLGKSLQALTVFAIDVQRGVSDRLLIVCPASLKNNWLEEIHEHTSFSAMVLNGTPAERQKQLEIFKNKGMQILIVNYEQVGKIVEFLNELQFDMVVYDEAHSIKNPKSQRTRACHSIYAPRHALLTGTPLMNHVSDLWSLLHRVDPVSFPNYWAFINRYAVFGGYQNRQIVGIKNEKELKEKLSVYMLRRRKADVLDLPEKQRIQVKVDLHPEQVKLYKQVKEDMELTLPDDPTPIEINNAMTRFQKLKQICGTTATIEGYDDYSMKLDRVTELALEIADNGGHIVMFTQFRGVLACAIARLEAAGLPVYALHGDVPIGERQDVVKRWTDSTEPAVMVGMLQVAGVGLTMTKARHLIFIDKDFVPAINEQAEDRIHRIGADTTQPVQIYEMICRGTIESRVEQILRTKQKIFGEIVNESDFKKKLLASLAAEEDE